MTMQATVLFAKDLQRPRYLSPIQLSKHGKFQVRAKELISSVVPPVAKGEVMTVLAVRGSTIRCIRHETTGDDVMCVADQLEPLPLTPITEDPRQDFITVIWVWWGVQGYKNFVKGTLGGIASSIVKSLLLNPLVQTLGRSFLDFVGLTSKIDQYKADLQEFCATPSASQGSTPHLYSEACKYAFSIITPFLQIHQEYKHEWQRLAGVAQPGSLMYHNHNGSSGSSEAESVSIQAIEATGYRGKDGSLIPFQDVSPRPEFTLKGKVYVLLKLDATGNATIRELNSTTTTKVERVQEWGWIDMGMWNAEVLQDVPSAKPGQMAVKKHGRVKLLLLDGPLAQIVTDKLTLHYLPSSAVQLVDLVPSPESDAPQATYRMFVFIMEAVGIYLDIGWEKRLLLEPVIHFLIRKQTKQLTLDPEFLQVLMKDRQALAKMCCQTNKTYKPVTQARCEFLATEMNEIFPKLKELDIAAATAASGKAPKTGFLSLFSRSPKPAHFCSHSQAPAPVPAPNPTVPQPVAVSASEAEWNPNLAPELDASPIRHLWHRVGLAAALRRGKSKDRTQTCLLFSG